MAGVKQTLEATSRHLLEGPWSDGGGWKPVSEEFHSHVSRPPTWRPSGSPQRKSESPGDHRVLDLDGREPTRRTFWLQLMLVSASIQQVTSSGAGRHSLWVLGTCISGPSQLPEFSCILMLDDLQVAYYDSTLDHLVTSSRDRTPLDLGQNAMRIVHDMILNMRDRLRFSKHRFNLSEGLHVQQRIAGCEIQDGQPTIVMSRDGVDGQDSDIRMYNTTHFSCTVRDASQGQVRKMLVLTEQELQQKHNYTCTAAHLSLDNRLQVSWRAESYHSHRAHLVSPLVLVALLLLLLLLLVLAKCGRPQELTETQWRQRVKLSCEAPPGGRETLQVFETWSQSNASSLRAWSRRGSLLLRTIISVCFFMSLYTVTSAER
ncbi:uncharacterized protein ACB058_004972 [Synchiropus picturatus]